MLVSMHYNTICRTAIKLFARQSDLSTKQCMNQQRKHYDTIYPSGRQLLAIRSDSSRQQHFTNRHFEETSACLCVTIRFVQTANVFMHNDSICPIAENNFSLHDLSCWQSCFCNTIGFVQTATVFMHYDKFCPDSCITCP